MARRFDGNETWLALRDWLKDQAAAERLSGQILLFEGYQSVDPSHPLGGRDGLKDIVCKKNQKTWVAGVYFPRGQQNFSKIKTKFTEDLQGVKKNDSDGFIFLTNQELRLAERKELTESSDCPVEIYHLERISALLNSPPLYGVRLEFLNIEMTKEEQLAFIASRDEMIEDIRRCLLKIEESACRSQEAESVLPKYEFKIGNIFASKKLHRCSYCGFGYFIRNLNPFLSPKLYAGTITCPKCGNTESIS